jgi:hypothetical protein
MNEWKKENEISLFIGMIQDNNEKTQADWGVQSLPWLILTDKEHIVTDEGFGISQLNEKMKQ